MKRRASSVSASGWPCSAMSREMRVSASDGRGHHLVHARRRGKQPGQVADGELDAVEDLGERHQLAQLGEPAERLHSADHGVERLAVAG